MMARRCCLFGKARFVRWRRKGEYDGGRGFLARHHGPGCSMTWGGHFPEREGVIVSERARRKRLGQHAEESDKIWTGQDVKNDKVCYANPHPPMI
jgi:hypothetical protein